MFNLISEYKPTGDQPKAIKLLSSGINNGEEAQTLLGVTGSGKTFTIANVITNSNKPTLVISHNKTLAAQLYQEFKTFFPNNKVEYFVSYYDYYQPESYMPTTDTYIAKDLSINAEIQKLRLSTTSSLASGRKDVIVVSSVSCIYGIGNPENFENNLLIIKKGEKVVQRQLLFSLVDMLYQRTVKKFERGTFRVQGEVVDIFPAYADFAYKLIFWGDEIEDIQIINPHTGTKISNETILKLFPANLFVTNKEHMKEIIKEIQSDLQEQIKFFCSKGMDIEANRIKERTELDLEMMRELGFCSGVENYSRYFDRRNPGQRPFCLIDYFPKDFLMIIDESHVTMPQIRAMYGGDRARKLNLVQHAFRLPSAMDNRPLKVEEFERLINQIIFVSATPAIYELEQSNGVIVEQIIRPTGLLDPKIEVKPSQNQIDDILEQINITIDKKERILVTTLTKRMAEELSKYLRNIGIKCTYIHSEIKTLERIEIINELREGKIDVLIGVNLLREGLDLPEVSLVIILDADKEGFLRNVKSLIQTIGRAARNRDGKVIMYADNITNSMQEAIDETSRRRLMQMDYNKKHNITPKTIIKNISGVKKVDYYSEDTLKTKKVSDPALKYIKKEDIKAIIKDLKSQMLKASKNEDFMNAAKFRDEIEKYKKMLD
ncbi:MAG: excinuclease ABC subunit UvrB [Bacteroidetes bacterium]|nr:excinuclease ABC subunit UvrB [Bacteroidota bacterium]